MDVCRMAALLAPHTPRVACPMPPDATSPDVAAAIAAAEAAAAAGADPPANPPSPWNH
jgi:hypothetical protein